MVTRAYGTTLASYPGAPERWRRHTFHPAADRAGQRGGTGPVMTEELRRIPLRSLKGQTEEATNALRDGLYLDELKRQAIIVNNNIVFAWRRAVDGCSATDPEVWAALQA